MDTQPQSESTYCGSCNSLIAAVDPVCPRCGAAQPQLVRALRQRSVAVLLAHFLGGFGAHKFYLGQPWQGMMYILFCWTLVPVMIGYIDFLRLAIMSDAAFSARYN